METPTHHLRIISKKNIGDILWYLAKVAEQFGFSLTDIAEYNLVKTSDRWQQNNTQDGIISTQQRYNEDHFDSRFEPNEQLPRYFEVHIRPVKDEHSPESKVEIIWNGSRVADPLDDNTYEDSGYRFHDAFHLANAAVLGWSPVARFCNLQKKTQK